MNDTQPIIEIKSKMDILHKFINIIVIFLSFFILYGLYMTTSLTELIKAIKEELTAILVFPFIVMIWVFFCLNGVIFNNQRKMVLYNDYFIVQTNQFLFKKVMEIHYVEYVLGVRFRPPHFFSLCVYILWHKKKKLPFGWFDAKIKANFITLYLIKNGIKCR